MFIVTLFLLLVACDVGPRPSVTPKDRHIGCHSKKQGQRTLLDRTRLASILRIESNARRPNNEKRILFYRNHTRRTKTVISFYGPEIEEGSIEE